MKKILILFLVVALLTGTLVSVTGLSAEEEAKPIYVAFGDSIAAGYRLTVTEKPACVAFAQEECGKAAGLYVNLLGTEWDAEVWNYAQNGRTTAGLLAYLENADDALKAQIRKADIITISIGGNDLLGIWDEAIALAIKSQLTGYIETNQTWDTMISTLKSNYGKIVELIHAINPDVPIYGQTMYNPYKYNSTYTVLGLNVGSVINPYVKLLNNAYAELDEMYGYLTFADVASAVNSYEASFYSDGDFHPTEYGHAVMASAFLAAVPAPKAHTSSSASEKSEQTVSSSTNLTAKTTATAEATRTTAADTKTKQTETAKSTSVSTSAAKTSAATATDTKTESSAVSTTVTVSPASSTASVTAPAVTATTAAGTETVKSTETASVSAATKMTTATNMTTATVKTGTAATSSETKETSSSTGQTATASSSSEKTVPTVSRLTEKSKETTAETTGTSAEKTTVKTTVKTTAKTTAAAASSSSENPASEEKDPGPAVAILALILTGAMITALYIRTKNQR